MQARLNGRDPGELLDEIEAEGFEPDGWSFEVGLVDQSNLHNNAMQQKCIANMFLKICPKGGGGKETWQEGGRRA